MKRIGTAAFLSLTLGTAASANCVPPMQTLFACTFENSDSRVEFCHEIAKESTANASSVPGDAQSYSFARGIAPTELYFKPTTSFFNAPEATATDRKIYGNGVTGFLVTGYENVDYVYAALLAVSEEYYDGYYGAEVRVFRNIDEAIAMKPGSEVSRHFCEEGSVIVNQYEFRP